ncbi:hypothetical protein Poli38472_013475 [Pythium oligandrum]|uniref:MaoC-like domain-containing protein n=1 Tax=Pythium oligandrum TaxID=41045 RepID=A0A8K1C7U5_PYTOL|nr:hypothetical protein Poli38472_013475 [Pythium oligandrum]|eukprot:TMW58001.1 hypothetical protein Poli38472_013475 [Pythium oligandrum]
MLVRRAAPCAWAATRGITRRSLSTAPFSIQGALTTLPHGEIPAIGVDAHVIHTFRLEDTKRFAELNGDSNPIHTDADFAQREGGFAAPIVQGMLSASLFATIFGRTIPGAVYISQALRWRIPLLVDEQVRASIRVVRVRKRFVDCETLCERTRDGAVIVEGQATVLLPPKPSNTGTAA